MTTTPGWYHDEHGTVRWFDGERWTDHVRDEPAPAAEGPAEGPSVPLLSVDPDETTRRRAPWLLVGVAVVLVVALAAAVVLVTGGPDDVPTASPGRGDAASSDASATEPDATDVEEVAADFMTAALDVDCERVAELITPRMREDGEQCGAGGVESGDLGEATFENSPAEIDGSQAEVRSSVSDLEGSDTDVQFVMVLELTDAGWLVDDFRTV